MAVVPEDDDREGQQRLRLPISGADRVSEPLTPVLAPAVCPALKRGLRRIEQALCSLSSPFTAGLNWCFLKPALEVGASGIMSQTLTPALLSFMFLPLVLPFSLHRLSL